MTALAPINGQPIDPAAVTTGVGRFVDGSADTGNDGTVSLQFVFGGDAKSTTLIFTGGSGRAVLLVTAGDDAAADTGPRVYSLADSAGGHVHTWDGGDASSAEFENVANLVIVSGSGPATRGSATCPTRTRSGQRLKTELRPVQR